MQRYQGMAEATPLNLYRRRRTIKGSRLEFYLGMLPTLPAKGTSILLSNSMFHSVEVVCFTFIPAVTPTYASANVPMRGMACCFILCSVFCMTSTFNLASHEVGLTAWYSRRKSTWASPMIQCSFSTLLYFGSSHLTFPCILMLTLSQRGLAE